MPDATRAALRRRRDAHSRVGQSSAAPRETGRGFRGYSCRHAAANVTACGSRVSTAWATICDAAAGGTSSGPAAMGAGLPKAGVQAAACKGAALS
jgi:hypothetical protein